mgnify:FL=1
MLTGFEIPRFGITEFHSVDHHDLADYISQWVLFDCEDLLASAYLVTIEYIMVKTSFFSIVKTPQS